MAECVFNWPDTDPELLKNINSVIEECGGYDSFKKIAIYENEGNLYKAEVVKTIALINKLKMQHVCVKGILKAVGMSEHVYNDFIKEHKSQIIRKHIKKSIKPIRLSKRRSKNDLKIINIKTKEEHFFNSFSKASDKLNCTNAAVWQAANKKRLLFKTYSVLYI